MINTCGQLKQFSNKLSDGECRNRYGEVFITSLRTIVLRCRVCDEEHQFYKKFAEHIFQHYDARAQQMSAEAALPIKQEIEFEESQITEVGTPSAVCIKETEVQKESMEFLTESSGNHKRLELERRNAVENMSSQDEITGMYNSAPKIKHKLVMRKKNQSKCNICGYVFSSVHNLKVHRRRHLGDTRFECGFCKNKFYTRDELMVHEHRHRGNYPFTCKYCGVGYHSASTRNRHERQHLNNRRTSAMVLRINNEVVNSDNSSDLTRQNPSEIVNYPHIDEYESPAPEKEHELKTKSKEYKCDVCGYMFTQIQDLKVHRRRHLADAPFKCSLCEKKFCTYKEQRLHEQYHTGERPYICKYCGKTYVSSRRRSTHERKHEKGKGASIVVRLKGGVLEEHNVVSAMNLSSNREDAKDRSENHIIASQYPSALKIEQPEDESYIVGSAAVKVIKEPQKMAGERKYKCDICGRAFAKSQNLQVHRQRHQCGYCKKKLCMCKERQSQEQQHTDGCLFICKYCGEKYHSSYNCSQHERTHEELLKELSARTDTTVELLHKKNKYERVVDKNLEIQNNKILDKSIQQHVVVTKLKEEISSEEEPTTFGEKKTHVKVEIDMDTVSAEAGNLNDDTESVLLRESTDKINLSQSVTTARRNRKPRLKNREYKCDICEYVFANLQNLKVHRRRHLGDARFNCSFCEKQFFTLDEKRVHERQHTGERPFICKFCGQGYTSSSFRNRHEKRHEKK